MTKEQSPYGKKLKQLVVMLCICTYLSGCYGTFPLTNAVYRINGKVSGNTVLNSIVMIVFAIFGVYGISMLIDAIILNSVEFWQGETMEIGKTYTDDQGNTVTLAKGENENEAILQVYKKDELVSERLYRRHADGTTSILTMQGELVAVVQPTYQGEFLLTKAGETEPMILTAEKIAELRTSALAKSSNQPTL